MSEWKPGDVGTSTAGERFIVNTEGKCFWPGIEKGDWSGLSGEPEPADRPVVVIDAEDAEQVERLRDILLESVGLLGIEGIAAALREFACPTPPRPEEPTGLGAVVEDAEGRQWTRIARGVSQWQIQTGAGQPFVRYGEIDDVVRVLSPGVEAS